MHTLSRALTEQRAANMTVVRENKELVREVRALDERNRQLLQRLQAEEERASENESLADRMQAIEGKKMNPLPACV